MHEYRALYGDDLTVVATSLEGVARACDATALVVEAALRSTGRLPEPARRIVAVAAWGCASAASIRRRLEEWEARTARITQAGLTLQWSLDTGGWGVRDDDLDRIATTLAGLAADERAAVLDGLTTRQWDVWIDQLQDSAGILGGWTGDERASWFVDIGALASARHLFEIYRRLTVPRRRHFAELVAGGAPGEVLGELARSVAAMVDEDPAAAAAVASLAGALAPPARLRLVEALYADGRLLPLLAFAVERTPEGEGDASALVALAEAAASSSDPGVLAHAFAGGMAALARAEADRVRLDRRTEGGDLPGTHDVLDVLAGLIGADPEGAVNRLRVEPGLDDTGDALTGWFRAVLEEDRYEDAGRVFGGLLGDRDSMVGRFLDPGADAHDLYPSAANLGFAGGAFERALVAIADDADRALSAVQAVVAIPTQALGPVGATIDLMVGGLAGEEVDRHDALLHALRIDLRRMLVPRTGDGDYVSGPATAVFEAERTRVLGPVYAG